MVLAAVPSSYQFFLTTSTVHRFVEIPKDALEVVDFVRRTALPGSVLLARGEEIRIPLLSMTPVRVPYQSVYVSSFLREREIEERLEDLQQFWTDWDKGRLRRDIASKYEVDYVVARAPFDFAVSSFNNRSYHVYRFGFTSTGNR